ncbi:hypothetical protein AXG93_3667s1050 [Marchantia polymorpha subsp. ruderalis]|uniref:Uncharacterized protein n=1 Tax=Marchantia polymorpha subsp. ruderalis TaxID=1480154 RepID=A0A176W129_MARPO|nr:hypothetical protein AXG93_3667s1050 [Marchantia polymorpha subsp. ruderalis]
MVSTPSEKKIEVLIVSSDTEEDPVSLEKIVDRVVEGVAREATLQQPVASELTSMGTIILEIIEDPSMEEIQSGGINAADVMCGQVMPLLRYLDSKLEKYVGSTTVGSYMKLANIETTRRAAVDLWNRLEASRMTFNVKSRRVDELTADLAKKDYAHATELATKTKVWRSVRLLDLWNWSC